MEAMQTALDRFKRKMAASNRRFWTAKVHALEQDSTLTDRQRLDLVATYAHLASWPTSGHGSSITTCAQILLRPGDAGYVDLNIDGDGVAPPKPAAVRARYITALDGMLQQVYATSPKRDAEGPSSVAVPDEFRDFLALTDGVSDFDYHRMGACGLDGVFITEAPNRFWMSNYLPERKTWEDAGWTVASGWQAAIGDEAATQILFCRKQEGTAEERSWGWRVFNYDAEEPEGRWFKGIKEFLAFKADWLERLPEGWETVRVKPPVDEGGDDWDAEEEDEEEVNG